MILGLDVGGTHTDAVLLENGYLIKEYKVATDQNNLFASVLKGITKVTSGTDAGRIKRAVLSTTLATNAIIQDMLPPAGMIISSGPGIDPEFFRTNEHYYIVSGSIDHRGREIVPVIRDEIKKTGDILKKAGIKNIGIVGKFSVRNPAHELLIKEILKDDFERIFMGHRISGNLNFPRRIATTFLNASVHPVHKKFITAVKNSLKEKGMNIPIHILKADGGTMNFDTSIDFPAQTILSGPSASIMGAMAFAPEDEECLVLDIGGTTTDMAILVNKVPLLRPLGIGMEKCKTLIRALDTRSIGIGGDSYVRVENKKIIIGPVRKGPAMAYGGESPTPTDALFVLGMQEDGDKEAAARGIKSIAVKLDMSVEKAASKIFDMACRIILDEAHRMIREINDKPVYTVHELKEGFKVSPERILVLGGPAPCFAKRMEELSGFRTNAVPKWGVANAIGAALARTTSEVTLFADTEQQVAGAPEENFMEKIGKKFSGQMATEKAFDLLRQKAVRSGARAEDLELEVVEEQEFNIVRGFYTSGKNIRVKVQVKPGLIRGYDELAKSLAREMR